jgi:PAS domain S-box-containing protein
MTMTHVLIVEDQAENRNLLKMLLEANGYRVTAAGDGLEALAAARRDPPDAIVSDALMPNMDGFALCRAWMQDSALRSIPFIFYSATYVRPDDEQFATALGAVRYLIKPLEAEVFLGELRAVLQQWAGHAAPAPASPLDDTAAHALHESVLARKVEDKMAQLEAANRKLRESEEKYRSIYGNMQDVYVEATLEGTILEMSPQVEILSRGQYKREDLIGASVNVFYADPKYRQAILLAIKQHGRAIDMESVFRNRDGSLIPCSVSAAIVSGADGKPKSVGTLRDITKRKQGENELVEAEARFRSLVEQSFSGIFVIQDKKLAYCNPRFVEILGYASEAELIGKDLLSLPIGKDVTAAAETLRRLFQEEVGPVSHAFAAVRKDGSIIELGLQGIQALYQGQPALLGMMQDISEKKRAEERIQRYIAQIENAFVSTVQVVTTLGEMRDPYTAGHQRRVAEIAVAIGAELGFDAHRQEGLRVAGYLHDVGKIRIPSDILSKPGKLSRPEFQLVQGHAQASYDVLKDVEFPWPVAEVALQHHERMDGSGYPQGLKGEAILLEARIMAVADVIEAMSSHRPYRAGLEIEAALSEIERGRGSAYDAEVADASLRLFRERRYSLPA